MRKFCLILAMTLTFGLSGCGSVETFETLGEISFPDTPGVHRNISFSVPKEAAASVAYGENGQLYVCEGYELWVQTLPGGNMTRTVKAVSGYDCEDLTVLEQQTDGVKRYDFAWTSAGEEGAMIGRAAVLDDGNYHYVLTAMCDALDAGELRTTWDTAFQSFSLD